MKSRRVPAVALGLPIVALGALALCVRYWPDSETSFITGADVAWFIAGIMVWLHRVALQADVPLLERQGAQPRAWGLAIMGLGFLFTGFVMAMVPRKDWPLSVDAAVGQLRDETSEENRRKIAYLHSDEVGVLYITSGMAILNDFGLVKGNWWLQRDCNKESTESHDDPEECSEIIIEHLHARLRSELPAAERDALNLLQTRLNHVQLPEKVFADAPLSEIAAWLQAQVDSQLEPAERFQIRLDPWAAWHKFSYTFRAGRLARELAILKNNTGVDVETRLPDVWIVYPIATAGPLPVLDGPR